MSKLGFLLVTAGFLAGALASVVHESTVRWGWFIPAAAVGFVGVALVQLGRRREVRATERLTSNVQAIQDSLGRIARNMAQLNAEKQLLDPHEVRHRLEELFADDLSTFITARESIAYSYGLAAYAEVMSPFAAGERYLNRAWCASADGYVDEVHRYLAEASDQFASSLDKVPALGGATQCAQASFAPNQPSAGSMKSGIRRTLPSAVTQARTLEPSASSRPVLRRVSLYVCSTLPGVTFAQVVSRSSSSS
jgi:hypothetical protein